MITDDKNFRNFLFDIQILQFFDKFTKKYSIVSFQTLK